MAVLRAHLTSAEAVRAPGVVPPRPIPHPRSTLDQLRARLVHTPVQAAPFRSSTSTPGTRPRTPTELPPEPPAQRCRAATAPSTPTYTPGAPSTVNTAIKEESDDNLEIIAPATPLEMEF